MDDFELFWSIYPRKVGKAMARAKWSQITADGLDAKCRDRDGNVMKLALHAPAQALLDAVKVYAYQCMDAETPQKYIAHPTTWLNQARWEDYDEQTVAAYVTKYDTLQEYKRKHNLRVVG